MNQLNSIKKLTRNQELKKLSVKSNYNNMINFKKILPDFFYSSKSEKRIISSLDILKRDFKNQYFDNLLLLSKDRRVFYEIELTPEDNKSYQTYLAILKNKNHPSVYKYNLLAFNNFKSGKIKDGKQSHKLFKFLLKNNIISQDELSRITDKKIDGKTYICISRNPIDYLFCSTNQSFGSCLNLKSDYHGAFYMALPGLSLDTNRAMIFLTNGKYKKYTIKNNEFKHFKIISRAWLILCNQDKIFIEKNYPQKIVNFADYLRKIGLKTIDPESKRISSRFHFSPAHDENSDISQIYIDSLNFYKNGKESRYDSLNGTTGCFTNYSYCNGFENLNGFCELTEDDENSFECEGCGNRFDNDEMYSDDYSCYCSDCFYERYTYCTNCDAIVDNDNRYTGSDDNDYCQYCFDDLFFECENCGKIFDKDDCNQDDNGNCYCSDCYSDIYKYCECCEQDQEIDGFIEINNIELCEYCAKKYTFCEECNEQIRKTDAIVLNGLDYCQYCFDAIVEDLQTQKAA